MHSAPASRSGSGRRIALLAGLTVKKPGFRIGASFRAAFSDDGIHLVTVGKRVTVWDVAERKRVASVHPFSHELEADVSPDSCWLVVKNTLGDVVVLERETLAERIRLPAKPYREGTAQRAAKSCFTSRWDPYAGSIAAAIGCDGCIRPRAWVS